MVYKLDGYFPNDVARVYGYDSKGVRAAIFKGYFNYKKNTVTLYPHALLRATTDTIGKVTIPIMKLQRET